MSPRQITALVTFGIAIFLAICIGVSIALEDYNFLALAICAVVIVGVLITPGYVPLLIVGLLIPFSLPLPFVWNFPVLAIAMGICIVKYWLQRGLAIDKQVKPIRTVDWSCGLFFAWVFVRYCLKPSIPNVMGYGRNVTGFRDWLNYALCFGVLFFLGRFIGNRQGLLKLMRWLAIVSVFFSVLLLAAAFSKSMAVWAILTYLGMFVTTFDNGFLRFVVLPGFGLILLSLALLPNLLTSKPLARWVIGIIGLSTIIVGGNRSSFGAAIIVVVAIPFLRRNIRMGIAIVGVVITIAVSGYLAGNVLSQLPETGFLRALALVSPDLAEVTGGEGNMEWREARWERAMEEIRNHPLVGEGYGGLENAFEFADPNQMEEASMEMSLATGGAHNGYIASALALGIPESLLFVYILVHQVIANVRRAYGLHNQDPLLADSHCFVAVNLIAHAATIFIGTDLNAPMIWFILGLGFFLFQLRSRERQHPRTTQSFARSTVVAQMA